MCHWIQRQDIGQLKTVEETDMLYWIPFFRHWSMSPVVYHTGCRSALPEKQSVEVLISRVFPRTIRYKPTGHRFTWCITHAQRLTSIAKMVYPSEWQGRHLRGGGGYGEGAIAPLRFKQKNNMQCKTPHTRRHITARRLPYHCDVQTVCLHKYVTITRPPSPPNLMFHFLKSSWRSYEYMTSIAKMVYPSEWQGRHLRGGRGGGQLPP